MSSVGDAPSGAPTAQPQPAVGPVRVGDSHAATMSDLIRQHKHSIESMKRANEEKYRKACQSAATASVALATATNHDVMEIFNAEQHIELQIKELAQQSEAFEKKMLGWSQFFLKFNKELKEVGDLANWSRCVEHDVQETVKILDEVSTKKRKALGIGS